MQTYDGQRAYGKEAGPCNAGIGLGGELAQVNHSEIIKSLAQIDNVAQKAEVGARRKDKEIDRMYVPSVVS